ncbi:DUF3322 domain-containing protein [Flavisolibacter nicotianae]|uniref:DUF3322 domain-containing protein n=1 Tax=Flavisolibacter nicotianae TaxID=2364882 RepID=UPI000EAB7750|nr:DUF3322 domain-containing protein [Flavisolibacter nicotianae]
MRQERLPSEGRKYASSSLRRYKVVLKISGSEPSAVGDNSKEFKGYGYRVILVERQFEKIGRQLIPEKISIETLEDCLKLISKQKEYNQFLRNFSLIQSEIPRLVEWVKSNPLKLIEHDTWEETLKVCKYFIQNCRLPYNSLI